MCVTSDYRPPLAVPVPAPGMPVPSFDGLLMLPRGALGPLGRTLGDPAPLVPVPAFGSDSLSRPVPELF